MLATSVRRRRAERRSRALDQTGFQRSLGKAVKGQGVGPGVGREVGGVCELRPVARRRDAWPPWTWVDLSTSVNSLPDFVVLPLIFCRLGFVVPRWLDAT
jgi:hypothetical protein